MWVKALAQLAPQVKVAIFLDDRTVWATGPGAAQQVLRAMQQAQPVDAALGFTLHPDKLESFATRKADKEFLQQNHAFVGSCQTSFKLLGLLLDQENSVAMTKSCTKVCLKDVGKSVLSQKIQNSSKGSCKFLWCQCCVGWGQRQHHPPSKPAKCLQSSNGRCCPMVCGLLLLANSGLDGFPA